MVDFCADQSASFTMSMASPDVVSLTLLIPAFHAFEDNPMPVNITVKGDSGCCTIAQGKHSRLLRGYNGLRVFRYVYTDR